MTNPTVNPHGPTVDPVDPNRVDQARYLTSSASAARRKAGIDSSFKSLRFPQEVGGSEVPAYIRFEPKEYSYGSLESYGNAVGNSGGSVFAGNQPVTGYTPSGGNIRYGGGTNNGLLSDNFSLNAGPLNIKIKNPIGGIVQNLARGAEDIISDLTGGLVTANISTLFNNSSSIVSGRVDISQALSISQKMKIGKTTSYSQGSINLFLPHELSTNSSVDTGLSNLGAGAAASLSSIRNMQAGGVTGSNVAESVKDVLAGTLVEYTASNEKFRTALAVTEGIVANNFSYAVFKSVQHRKFKYTFKMIAKNEAESEEIKKICDMFLYYMLPNKISEADFSFFEIPAAWDLKYMFGSNPLGYHLQPKECFLTNVDVKYGGESKNALYNNGAPLEVELGLSFVEIEPLYRS